MILNAKINEFEKNTQKKIWLFLKINKINIALDNLTKEWKGRHKSTQLAMKNDISPQTLVTSRGSEECILIIYTLINWKNLEDIDKLWDTYDLHILNQEHRENLNRPIFIK